MNSRVMYVVRIRVPLKLEKEWNEWHDKEHIPMVLEQPGFMEVRKFRKIAANSDEAEYFLMYELRNQTAYEQYANSDEGARLRQHYLDAWGSKTTITRWAWQQTFQLKK